MSDNRFKQYRRRGVTEARLWEPGETLEESVSISKADLIAGSPKEGDRIARNVRDHSDQWLISAEYWADQDFELMG